MKQCAVTGVAFAWILLAAPAVHADRVDQYIKKARWSSIAYLVPP
jgi:hypothetical protein